MASGALFDCFRQKGKTNIQTNEQIKYGSQLGARERAHTRLRSKRIVRLTTHTHTRKRCEEMEKDAKRKEQI